MAIATTTTVALAVVIIIATRTIHKISQM
jgi:hypothetical protein